MKMNRNTELWLIDTLIFVLVYVTVLAMPGLQHSPYGYGEENVLLQLGLFYVCIMSFRYMVHLYSSIWRYANVAVYVKLIFADILGGMLFIVLGRGIFSVTFRWSDGFFIVMAEVLATLLSRFCYQFLYAYTNKISDSYGDLATIDSAHKINIAIVGAGNVGATLASELLRNPKSHYYPYCFVDIDESKIGNEINGIRIYREDEETLRMIMDLPVQEIVIALPDTNPEERKALYNLYEKTGCKIKIYD